jgi:hypothetical protein
MKRMAKKKVWSRNERIMVNGSLGVWEMCISSVGCVVYNVGYVEAGNGNG